MNLKEFLIPTRTKIVFTIIWFAILGPIAESKNPSAFTGIAPAITANLLWGFSYQFYLNPLVILVWILLSYLPACISDVIVKAKIAKPAKIGGMIIGIIPPYLGAFTKKKMKKIAKSKKRGKK